jgi:hypothetical protein
MSYYTADDVDFKTELTGDLSPLHQICPKNGQTLRIALLTEVCKPKGAHYHWYRNSFYRCNTPEGSAENECCRHVQRSWTCVCLALLYMNAGNTKIERGSSVKYRIGYVGLSQSVYREVSALQTEAPGCDLYYSNNGHYEITGASKTPKWKDSPQAAEIAREAKRWADGKMLTSKLGKKITDEEWCRLIKTGTTLPEEEE